MIGKVISHYRITKRLGEGGYGVVYRAIDTKLNRMVALKLLPPETTRESGRKERFIREAQTASAIDHPNICTVYEIDETREGQMYICMAYCEGESLKEFVARGRVELATALDYAIQIVEGIREAHENNIIHRDIKPGNIMVTKKGQVKILDFGLATITGDLPPDERETISGTTPYMSPEQAKGENIDNRTDIWSFGVLLYELICGRKPFQGDYTASVLYAITNEEPLPPSTIVNDIPPELDGVIATCLKKNPGDRYQSAQDLLADLRGVTNKLDHRSRRNVRLTLKSPLSGTGLIRTITYSAVTIVLLITAVLLVPGLLHRERPPVTIAILDFENHTRDPALSSILADLLVTGLSSCPHVKVLSRERMKDLQHDLSIQTLNDSTGIMLSRYARIRALVSTKILQIGNMYRIDTYIYDVTTKDLLFADQVQGTGQDAIFDMIDDLADKIRAGFKILPELERERQFKLSDLTTTSLDAYKLYSMSQSLYSEGPLKSIPYLEQAVSIDTNFVEALRTLAIAYDAIGDTPRALSTAHRASEISRERELREYLKSAIVEHRIRQNWDQAIEYLNRYLELEPHDIKSRLQLGYIYSRHKKEFSMAIEQFNTILAQDPNNLSGFVGQTYNYIGHAYLYIGQHKRAMEALEKYRKLHPNEPDPIHSMADALRFEGEYEKAIEQYITVIRQHPGFYYAYEGLGYAYLSIGKWHDAVSMFTRYLGAAPPGLLHRGHVMLARAYCIQGDNDRAGREIDETLLINPACCEAYWIRGLIELDHSGNLERSWSALDSMESRMHHPGVLADPACYYHLKGRILLTEQKNREALESLQQAADASQREFVYFKREVAMGHLQTGNTKETIREAKKLLEFNSNDAETLCLLGLAYEQCGDSRNALKCFKRARIVWSDADTDFRPLTALISKSQKQYGTL